MKSINQMSIGWSVIKMSKFKYSEVPKPGISFIDKVLYSVATVNVHKNPNLLRLEFWFCYSIKVSTLYHCVAAVIGSQAALLASCSGWFSKSSPSVLSFRGRKSTQRLHPPVKAPVLLSNRLVCDFFFRAATASPPPAEKRSSRYWQHREGKKCDEKAPRLHSVVSSPPVLCFHLLVSTDLCRCLCWIDSFPPCPALIGGCGWSSKWG